MDLLVVDELAEIMMLDVDVFSAVGVSASGRA